MTEHATAQKIPLIFFRSGKGTEPVREWLKELPEAERQAVGRDLLRAQWRWPVSMLYRGHLVALHGFIKKTQATPDEDLALARKRQKELVL
jgi:phage-related protein